MAKKSSGIEINPAVLRWARESAGWSIDEVADKLKTDSKLISKWETTPTKLKIGVLRQLASYYKRSFEVFLLEKPPKEAPIPKDFRLSRGNNSLSKDTLLAIRNARRLQEIAAYLISNFKQNLNPIILGAKLDDDPETIAIKERKKFNVDIESQQNWKSPYEAFRHWRSVIGGKNILVFQMPTSDEVRGFSLSDKKPFVIVINSSDTINARIFTLFHEYAHLILRIPGICDQTNRPLSLYESFEIEKWCNLFAGSFLMPKELVMLWHRELSNEKIDKFISHISNRFKVSREAFLLRLLKLQIVKQNDFERIWNLITSEKKKLKSNKDKVIAINVAKQCVNEKGRSFVSLVLKNKEKDFITSNQALEYLSVKTKHLENINNYL